jgi:YD repeat-containing protein
MKCFQIFALITVIGFISSCQKDQLTETNEAPEVVMSSNAPNVKLLKEFINPVNNDLIRYTYNSANEVIQEEHEDALITIIKKGTTVTIKDSNTIDKRMAWVFTGQLDKKGRLVSGDAVNTRVAGLAPSMEEHKMTYDAQGHLIQRVTTVNKGQNVFVHNFTFDNGNMVRYDVLKNNATYYSIIYKFGHLPDKNKLHSTQFAVANNFTGVLNNNLPEAMTVINASGNVSWSAQMIYNMDADGYPIKRETMFSNGNVWVFDYHY